MLTEEEGKNGDLVGRRAHQTEDIFTPSSFSD